MPKNSKFLPIAMVLIVTLVLAIVVLTERTNAPAIAGDGAYPHQICTFNRYCVGDSCSDEAVYAIAYFTHANGEPRLEITGMSPQATMRETNESVIFTSTGGDVTGKLTIFRNRTMDFTATQGESPSVIEHFASGTCDRPVTP